MTNGWRRAVAIIAAIACAVMLALMGTAAAGEGNGEDGRDDKNEKSCSAGEATGEGTTVVPGANLPFNQFRFDLCRTGSKTSDVTGFFSAVAPLSGGVVAAQGPVTCAAFDGQTVSFLYPLNEKSSPPPVFGPGSAILIVAKDGGPATADDTVGFFGPAPLAAFGGNNCDFSTLPAAVANNITPLPLGEGGITVRS